MASLNGVLDGIEAFRGSRLRTAVNVAGTVCAVGVTLTTMAVNDGARREASRQAARLGVNTIVLVARASENVASRPLTLRDAAALPRLVPAIAAVSPVVQSAQTVAGPVGSQPADVVGVTAAYFGIRHLTVERGRVLHGNDDDARARVCVIGARVARRLFGNTAALGSRVRIGHDSYLVVGVLADDGAMTVLVPLSALTARRSLLNPDQRTNAIWLRIAAAHEVADAAAVIRQALQPTDAAPASYDVVVARDLLENRDRTQRTFSVVTSITAALLFMLGGVAITNTMLATIADRTREIGLRRAVGATRRDVMLQCLLEASAVSLCGGALGIVAGVLLTAVTAAWTGWATRMSVTAVLSVLAVAALVGVVAGAYPAVRAARIQPIEAINAES